MRFIAKYCIAFAVVTLVAWHSTTYKAVETSTHIADKIVGTDVVASFGDYFENFEQKTYANKIWLLAERLATHGYNREQIEIFLEIATLESCRDRGDHEGCMNPIKTPPVAVKHCRSAKSGKWYVVEVSSTGGQAQCHSGDLEGMNEKSFGMFQILETTWKGYGCEGDRFNWENQIDCAVKIEQKSGFGAWSTYRIIIAKQ